MKFKKFLSARLSTIILAVILIVVSFGSLFVGVIDINLSTIFTTITPALSFLRPVCRGFARFCARESA